MVRGVSFSGGFETLQTRKSPFIAWEASMSDFCFADDVCHANPITGDGPRGVFKVCKTLKEG